MKITKFAVSELHQRQLGNLTCDLMRCLMKFWQFSDLRCNGNVFQTKGLIETRCQYYSWLNKKYLLSATRILKGYSRLVSNRGKYCFFFFFSISFVFICFPQKILSEACCSDAFMPAQFEARTMKKFQCQWPVTSVFTCTNASSKTEGIRLQRTSNSNVSARNHIHIIPILVKMKKMSLT